MSDFRSKLSMTKEVPLIQVHEKELSKLEIDQFSELGVGAIKENLEALPLYQNCHSGGIFL